MNDEPHWTFSGVTGIIIRFTDLASCPILWVRECKKKKVVLIVYFVLCFYQQNAKNALATALYLVTHM